MIFFKEYEMCLEALKVGNKASDEERRLAWALCYMRHAIVTYRKLDIDDRRFFTIDDLIFMRDNSTSIYDYISVPAARLRKVIKHIAENLHRSIVRENVLVPLHKANEFNSRSIAWISQRPGRTIREKLSGTKSVMAVRRRLSIDTAENRLFKAVVKRMFVLLQKKTDCLPKDMMPKEESELLLLCNKFLHSDEAEEIGIWTNLPPNNTLLSDRYYHEAWNTWNELKAINMLVKEDQEKMPQILATLAVFELLRTASQSYRFPQEPIFYDYETGNGQFWLQYPPEKGVWEYFNGIGKINRLRIAWDNTGCVTITCGKKERKFYFSFLSLLDEGRELIPSKHFNWQRVKKIIENALHSLCGSDLTKKTSKFLSKEPTEHEGHMGVVDIFSIRPRVVIDGEEILLEERLVDLNGEYNHDHTKRELRFGAGRSKALRGGHGIKHINTVISLVESDRANKKGYLQSLISTVRRYIKTDQLTLIYPDSYNEFQLQTIRQMARMYYFNARAMPKSLDVVFRMLYLPAFKNFLTEHDAFILIDQVSADISMTLIIPVFDEELAKRVPNSHGLIWEHHPSMVIDLEPLNTSLLKDEQEALDFLGRDIILSEASRMDFMTQEEEKVDLLGLRMKLIGQFQDVTDILKEFISDHERMIGNRNIHFLRLVSNLPFKENSFNGTMTDFPIQSIGEGIFHYDALASEAGDISLWRDYLPDISIKRMIGSFDLVKGSTFDYGSVHKKEISLPNTRFTLPKGKKEYHFQLHISNASKKSVYEAVIRNRAFPLKKDVECELKMNYTYNADNPYSLQFFPTNQKDIDFTVAKVEWEPLTHYPTQDLPYQEFPDGETWESLKKYPDKKNPEQTIDLPASLEEMLNIILKNPEPVRLHEVSENSFKKKIYIKATFFDGQKGIITLDREKFNQDNKAMIETSEAGINAYIFQKNKEPDKGREIVDLTGENWRGRDKIFHDCNIQGSIYRLIFSKDNFRFQSDSEKELGCVSYYVNRKNLEDQSRRWNFARDIIPAEETIYNVTEIYFEEHCEKNFFEHLDSEGKKKFFEPLESKKNWLLFLLHNVYGNGRNFSDAIYAQPDAPCFLKKLHELVDIYLQIRTDAKYVTVKNNLLHILALTNKDAGDDFYETLYDELQTLIDRGQKLPAWIGYAIGGYDTLGEKWLFDYLAGLDREDFLYILSAAVWRNSTFLINAPSNVLMKYFAKALDVFIKGYKNNGRFFTPSVRLFEMILAIFRLRVLKNKEIDEQLSLNNPKVKEFYHCLEKMIADKQFNEFNTRIKLTIKKNEEYAKYDIPDLVYALMVCISGTNEENNIIIRSIEEDEDSMIM